MIELVRDLRNMNILATFQNDPWKFTDVSTPTVIFQVAKCEKICQKFFFADYEKPGIYID